MHLKAEMEAETVEEYSWFAPNRLLSLLFYATQDNI